MNDNIHLSNDIEFVEICENLRIPKVSIIVPVYNVEQYLPKCIDSILNQTFTDFELLLIDDGSPDRSGIICDEYASQDPRVRVFHKENGGVGSARNLGLDNARGEWIIFVDGDDWIEFKLLYCVSKIFSSNIDLIQFGYYDRKGSKVKENRFVHSEITLTHDEYMYGSFFKRSLWVYCFRRSLIDNKIKFVDVKYGEDCLFVSQYLMSSSAFVVVLPDLLYNYLIREGSAINSIITESCVLDHFRVVFQLSKIYCFSVANSFFISKVINDILKTSLLMIALVDKRNVNYLHLLYSFKHILVSVSENKSIRLSRILRFSIGRYLYLFYLLFRFRLLCKNR